MTEKHKAQVALRRAAEEFAVGLRSPVSDQHDSAFRRIDARLMKAAIRYAALSKGVGQWPGGNAIVRADAGATCVPPLAHHEGAR